MGRMYAATFEDVAVSAVQDLFELNAPSDATVTLHFIVIGQESDVDSEMLSVTIERATNGGSGGSSPTARPLEVGSPAFGGTVEANNTTQATGLTQLHSDAFNVLAGWQYRPTPEERIVLSPSGRIVLTLNDAPGDALTMSGTIIFEEVGG